ncbi:MAG: hypothetical protein F6K30_04050, partial [Cyanothece sp. SIO2G6]|nr:hypothetical protein [Cyanothece sp. SIO2G6]
MASTSSTIRNGSTGLPVPVALTEGFDLRGFSLQSTVPAVNDDQDAETAAQLSSVETLVARRADSNSSKADKGDGTTLIFRQRPNRPEMEAFENGVLIERVRGRQNRPVPNAGPFTISAIDSADGGKRRNFGDRTWLDRGEGIGIRDGDDGNSSNKKRIDGDEILAIGVDGFTAQTALIELARLQSAGGALVRIEAFNGDSLVDSEIVDLGILPAKSKGQVSLPFSSDQAFDTLQISAAGNKTRFTFRSVKLLDAKSAEGTLVIDNFEFVPQDPDTANLEDKVLTLRPFEGNETALLIPDLGESFQQRLTLTAQGGAVEDGTFDLTVANPFVDITNVTLQGSQTNLIVSQSDNGEQQVTTLGLPDLEAGEEIVLEITSTITNNGVTADPLEEFNFEFELEDIPGTDDLGNATFNGKIYTSARYFETDSGSPEYALNEIDNYLITANVGDASSSLEAEVFTLAGNLVEGNGGNSQGKVHTLYALDLDGQVNPKIQKKNQTNYYSESVNVLDWELNWEPIPGVDIAPFVSASGSAGFELWEDLVGQGIFSQQTATTIGKDGSPSLFSTDTFTQTAVAGNIIDVDNPPPLLDFVDLTFGQDGNRLRTKVTQDGHVLAIAHGQQNRPTPGAGPFDIFAVDSSDSGKFSELV